MNNFDDSLSAILLSSPEAKIASLKSIFSQFQAKIYFSRDTLKSLLEIFSKLLNDSNFEVQLLSTNILTEIILLKEGRTIESSLQECFYCVVKNLGDGQPALRKYSHTFFMKYIKASGNFEGVIHAMITNGINNENWQIRQKCINSFQGLIISESAHLIWDSLNFKKLTENLIDKLSDPNTIISKASEQALLSLNQNPNFKILYKSLFLDYQKLFKEFLISYKNKISGQLTNSNTNNLTSNNINSTNVNIEKNLISNVSNNNLNKITIKKNDISKDATNNNNNVNNPSHVLSQVNEKVNYQQKVSNFVNAGQNIASSFDNEKKKIILNEEKKNIINSPETKEISKSDYLSHISGSGNKNDNLSQSNTSESNKLIIKKTISNGSQNNACEKAFGIFPQQLINNLDEKNGWEVRSTAIEEVEKIVENSLDNQIKDFIPFLNDFLNLLMRLLQDSNFKVCIINFNILSKILGIKEITKKNNVELIYPKLLEKLGDSKVAIRQAAIKIVKELFLNGKNNIESDYWLEKLLPFLENANQYLREEALNFISYFIYELNEFDNDYYEKLMIQASALLEDPKPKAKQIFEKIFIKVKNAALQVLIAISTKMNKYSFHSYLQKSFTIEGYEYLKSNLPLSSLLESDEEEIIEKKDVTSRQETPEIKKPISANIDKSPYYEISRKNLTPKEVKPINYAELEGDKPQSQNIPFQPSKKTNPFEMSPASSSRSTASHLLGQETSNNLTEKIKNVRNQEEQYEIIEKNNRAQTAIHPQEEKKIQEENRTYTAFTTNEVDLEKIIDEKTFLHESRASNRESRQNLKREGKTANQEEKRSSTAFTTSEIEFEKIIDDKTNKSESRCSNRESRYNLKTEELKENNIALEYNVKKKMEDFNVTRNLQQLNGKLEEDARKPELYQKFDNFNLSLPNNSTASSNFENANQTIFSKPQLSKSLNKKIQKTSKPITPINLEVEEKEKVEKVEPRKPIIKHSKEKKQSYHELKEHISKEEIIENEEPIEDEERFTAKTDTFQKNPKLQRTFKSEGKSNLDYKQACYVEKEDLEPAPSPEKLYKTIINDLKSDDWNNQFNGLNNLRRIICHHSEIISINVGLFHSLVIELLKLIESLRSSVSKNAMLTTIELAEKMKKFLDPETEHFLSRLHKKGMDANAFISEEVRKGLTAICTNCSENKTIPILITMANTKASQGKVNLLVCFDTIIEKNGNKLLNIKDADKMIFTLANLLFDGSNEVRAVSRSAFFKLYDSILDKNEILRILQMGLNDGIYRKIRLMIEKEFNAGSNDGKELISSKIQNSKIPFKPKESYKKSSTPDQYKSKGDDLLDSDKKKTNGDLEVNNYLKNSTMKHNPSNKSFNLTTKLKNSQEIDNLSSTFVNCMSNEWKIRFDSINTLTETAQKYSESLVKHKLANNFIDIFIKLITDPNTKVSLQALTGFNSILDAIKPILEINLNNVLTAIFQVLASFNANIREAAEENLNQLMKAFDKTAFLQHLCNGALYAVSKSRNLLIIKIIDIVAEVYNKKPTFIPKYVNPLIIKLLDENKSEFKSSLQRLISKLYELGGNEFVEGFPNSKIQSILEILGKREK